MKIIPLLDKVVAVEIDDAKSQTDSGILLPSSAQEKPCKAKVVAVGDGGYIDGEKVTMLVKAGDIILYSKYAGSEFKLENETFIILKQADILAKLED